MIRFIKEESKENLLTLYLDAVAAEVAEFAERTTPPPSEAVCKVELGS